MRPLCTAFAAMALLGLASCAKEPEYLDTEPGDPFAVAPRCTSGALRNPNESEGPEMMPGHACNTCHEEENAASGEGDAPIFGFAGTVFPTGHEPDNCIASGSVGAQVIVTDAMGKVHTAEVNATGNFLFEDTIVYPYRAKVVFQGRERQMDLKQNSGDCNSCHTAAGASEAPGRIVLP